jgi:hypothetical protein
MVLTAAYNTGIAGSWWDLDEVTCETAGLCAIVASVPYMSN